VFTKALDCHFIKIGLPGGWDFHSIKIPPVEITLPSPAQGQVYKVIDSPHYCHCPFLVWRLCVHKSIGLSLH